MTVTEGSLRRAVHALLAAHPPGAQTARAFLGARFDAGLAWVWQPPGAGGCGADVALQGVVDGMLADAGAPAPAIEENVVGHGMAAPTIASHGTPQQRRRFLRPLFTNAEIWCQLFSEPGAGSDLAAVATRAVADGDEWIVDGQKVWTTLGHTARWGLLVARTDPHVPKHQGLTYFVVDMTAPGVEVRPLRQMTGEAEFNEVFLTQVRVHDHDRIGSVGEGWRVAMTTLMSERVALGDTAPGRGEGSIAHALRRWEAHGGDPVLRDRLVRVWIEAEVARLTNMRARQRRAEGAPGPEGSIAKLAAAELNQHVYELCIDLAGAEGMLYEPGYEMTRPARASLVDGATETLFLRTRANTIEGGTSEVMRNVLGERVLGLPPEPKLDRDQPWSRARSADR